MLYIIILLASAIAQFFLPWWVIAPIAFIVCAWKAESGKKAYWAGTLAIATLWIVYAAYLNISSGGIMLEKIGNLFSENLKFLKSLNITITFFIIMAIIGSQVGGLSAIAGYHFKKLLN